MTTFDFTPPRLPVRRSALLAGVAALAVVAAVPSLLDSRTGTHQVSTSSAPVTASAAPDALPAANPVQSVLAAAPPAVQTAPAKVASAPAPTAAPATCLNSSDPSCGAFAWSPAPAANQPLTIAVEVTPAAPKAGDLVTVKVIASDPDALVTTNGGSFFFADPNSVEPQIGFPAVVDAGVTRYGNWTPPPAQPGRVELSFTHTFSQAGTFDFTFTALSGDEGDPGNVERNPYASRGSAKVPITVAS